MRLKSRFLLTLLSVATSISVFHPFVSRADTLYRGAAFVSLSEGSGILELGWMSVSEDGYIVAIEEGEPDAEALSGATEVIDLPGRIVMPGFVSGHSHLWQSAFRGMAPDGELWPWLDALHRTYGDDFAEGDLRAFTLHGALDQLSHGVTTTYNHTHWLDHDEAMFLEQFDAELSCPQRFVFSSCVDLSQTAEQWKQMLGGLIDQIDKSPGQSLLGVALNLRPYGPPSVAKAQVDLALEMGIDYQLHYLEQSGRQESDRAAWPGYLEAGIPNERATFAHFIHTDEKILQDAAQAGAGMVWNPLSNGRLGSGLANIPSYLDRGLKVGMGVDGQASADISDPFENMRMGLYATRMREENSDGMQPIDILRLHTLDTAKLLKVDDVIGSLEPGKFADFLVIDPRKPITGPVWDVAAHLVFACGSENIESVFVGGRKTVSEGELQGFDLPSLSEDVEQRVAALRQRHLEESE